MHISSIRRIGLLSVAAAALSLPSGRPSAADEDLTARVDSRIAHWQPTAEERQLDRIAWVQDIRSALRLGRDLQRPIFVFTLDGRMDTGRQ